MPEQPLRSRRIDDELEHSVLGTNRLPRLELCYWGTRPVERYTTDGVVVEEEELELVAKGRLNLLNRCEDL